MNTTTHLDMYMYITTHRVTTYTTEYSDNKYKKTAQTSTEKDKRKRTKGRVHWGRVHCRLLLGGVSSELVLGGWWIKVAGSGQTRSRASARQYSLILSNRYFCRSCDSPGGVMEGGLSTCDGVHTPRNSIRCSSTAVAVFLRKTTPGWSRSKRK